MDEVKGIVLIVLGCVAIATGLTAKQFYSATGVFGAGLSNRIIAKWKGRSLTVAAGIILIIIGINILW